MHEWQGVKWRGDVLRCAIILQSSWLANNALFSVHTLDASSQPGGWNIMHIRALKALTQSRKDMSPPAKQKSCDSEDVSMFTADSHHPHSPLEPSTLYPFHHRSSLPAGSFSFLQLLIKHICMYLTLVELLCSVSFWMAPVSQFLIFRKRGHLEGLPFCRDLAGEVLLSALGCKSTNESLFRAFEQFAKPRVCI